MVISATHEPVVLAAWGGAGEQDYGKYKLSCYTECWTKLRMWEMDTYDR